jgi:hypothetical protein
VIPEVGMKNIDAVSLRIQTVVVALTCLALCSSSQSELLDWQKQKGRYETLGADVNNYYRVVGLPRTCICQFMAGQPAYSEGVHDFFYVSGHPKLFIEVGYSDDGQNIRRFRFIEKSNPNTNKYGGWQTKNVRHNRSDFTTGISIVQLATASDHFKMPFESNAFTPSEWKAGKQRRVSLLFDIAHDYSLVGMRRAEVIDILGAPDYLGSAPKEKHLEFDFVDRYVMGHGCTGIYSVFEVAYEGGKVKAFRISSLYAYSGVVRQ